MFAQAFDTQATLEFALDVRRSLSKTPQRELESKYLYDDVGTALFETITVLPEYGLTRADERLLRTHADDIIRRLPSPAIVAELGSVSPASVSTYAMAGSVGSSKSRMTNGPVDAVEGVVEVVGQGSAAVMVWAPARISMFGSGGRSGRILVPPTL